LLHSIHKSTADALPTLINYLRTNGYTLRSTEDAVRGRYGGSSAEVVAAYNNQFNGGTTGAPLTNPPTTTAAPTTAAPIQATTTAGQVVQTTAPGQSTAVVAGTTLPQAGSTTAGPSPSAPGATTAVPTPSGISFAKYPGTTPDPTKACCSSLRSYVEKWCTGANLETMIVPNGGNLTLFRGVPRMSAVTNCAETDCVGYSAASSSAAYSLGLLVTMMMLAVFAQL